MAYPSISTHQSTIGNPPLLLGLVADLFFVVKIENVARSLGYRVRWIGNADDVAAPEGHEAVTHPSELLRGQAAAFIRLLVEEQPALVIFDLNHSAVPWERWIASLKSSAATRRTPIIAFGSHMDVETQKRAKEAGADAVLAKSRFTEALPELIQKYARIPDRAAIAEACEGELSPLAIKGLELFNAGEYFEAHEELERAWNEARGPARELYRAILQVAVAYLQITRGNYDGAIKMFMRARQWIEPLPDMCRGVQVGKLRQEAQRVREALERLGPERLGQFDWALLKPVMWN